MNSLSHLSNDELELRLKDLVTKERKLLHVILEHLKEIDSRKIHLDRAYPSLYEYLIKECGYSASAAIRRIEAARLLKDVPTMSDRIREGTLNLSQIGELSRAIKEKERTTGQKISILQKNELVSVIAGKTTQETQRELCMALDIELKEPEKQKFQKDESVHLSLTLSQQQYQILMKCKDLGAHLLPDPSLASLIEILATKFINSKIPKTHKADSVLLGK
ncbi:MAG: hypothetical protein J7501_04340 [Bdellovibrio sp.]|nr:hypothetical protein [Bdellovibrio sp.]